MASAVVETTGPAGSAHGGAASVSVFAASVLERREILKPVDTDQLVSMMRVWLGRV